jgi:hypothetical protein
MDRTRPLRGLEPMRPYVVQARLLVLGLVLVSLLGIVPAVQDQWQVWCAGAPPRIPAWACLVTLAACLQLGYALYLWQLPDGSSAGVVAVATLVAAVAYALALGATFASRNSGWFENWLQLADPWRGRRVAGWCFVMACVTTLLSYASGRLSARWQRELVRRQSAATR